jgi:hypothetical protein
LVGAPLRPPPPSAALPIHDPGPWALAPTQHRPALTSHWTVLRRLLDPVWGPGALPPPLEPRRAMSRPPPPSSPRPKPSVASPTPLGTRGTKRTASKSRDAFRALRRTIPATSIDRSGVAHRKATRFPATCSLDSGFAKPRAPEPPPSLPEARALCRSSVPSWRSSRHRRARSHCSSTPAPCALRRAEPLTLAPRDQRGLDQGNPRPPMPPKPYSSSPSTLDC